MVLFEMDGLILAKKVQEDFNLDISSISIVYFDNTILSICNNFLYLIYLLIATSHSAIAQPSILGAKPADPLEQDVEDTLL